MNTTTVSADPDARPSDERLWSAAVQGDVACFGQIVERYQSLVCAVTYARVGDVGLSQDLAQETFLTAWLRLSSLRQPERLRAWLCGIARTLAANARRGLARRSRFDIALEAISEPEVTGASPLDRLIYEDEAHFLDRALVALPMAYREALVLFYREGRSVADVAALLDVSEEVIRQRLSRGRAALREEVAELVESVLSRATPGADFTAAVLAALALTAPTSSAAAGASVAAATGASAAGAGGAGLGATAVAGPVLGLSTAWLASRLVRAGARSADERALLGRQFARGIGFALGMVAALLAALYLGRDQLAQSPWLLAAGTTAWTLALLGGFMWMYRRMRGEIADVRVATGTTDAEFAPELQRRGLGTPGPRVYHSRWRLLGLPVLAWSSSGLDTGGSRAPAACGWIAAGDLAISPLVAAGGVAIAPMAIGGVTLGLISLSVGGVALGGLAVGSLAFGWWALGIVAVAWKGAAGATAIAHDFAVGSSARAMEANTAAAAEWFRAQWFVAPAVGFLALLPWLVLAAIVVPLALLGRRAWRMRRTHAPDAAAVVEHGDRQALDAGRTLPVASPTSTGAADQRLHGLDALRAVALLLGLVLHSTMPYVLPAGVWAVGTAPAGTAPVAILGWLAYYLHSFRLEVFFLLAGFFGAMVVARRGPVAWARDRVRRIVLVFVVALVPMKVMLAAVWLWGGRRTGWLTLPDSVASLPLWQLAVGSLFEERWPDIALTHLWFLYYLAVINGLWLLTRVVLVRLGLLGAVGARASTLAHAVVASRASALWLALAVTPLLVVMRGNDIDTPDRSLAWHGPVLALYAFWFALGWTLFGARHLLPGIGTRWVRHLTLGLGVSVVAVAGVALQHQPNAWAVANPALVRWLTSFGTGLVMTASVLGWMGLFMARLSQPSAALRYLAAASYLVYIIHLPVMTTLQAWWAASGLPWWIQVPSINVVTLSVCVMSHHVWVLARRRLTGQS